MRIHLIQRTIFFLIPMLLLHLASGEMKAQIPGNVNNLPCGIQLLEEEFGINVPTGWEGQWMVGGPLLTEGWILQTGPSPSTPITGANGAHSGAYYAYLETNGPAPPNSAYKINTPPILLPSNFIPEF